MITKWKVANFKSIHGETELELGPLTIFAGANSSGKSTFIQSILLMAQTLSSKVASRPIILNGSLVSLGQFDDLKSNIGESDKITIKYTCRPLPHQVRRLRRLFSGPFPSTLPGRYPSYLREVTCEVSFDAGSSDSEQRDLLQIQPQLTASRLSCTYRGSESQARSISACYSSKVRQETAIEDSREEIPQHNLYYAVTLDDTSGEELRAEFQSAKPAGCTFRHFIPEHVICAVDWVAERADTIASVLQMDDLGTMSRGRRTIERRIFRMSRQYYRDIVKKPLFPGEIHEVLRNIFRREEIDFDQVLKQICKEHKISIPALTIEACYEQRIQWPKAKSNKIKKALEECQDLSAQIYNGLRSSASTQDDEPEYIRLPWISDVARYLDGFFTSSLKYLGPLRDEPKPLYPLAPVMYTNDVGLRGENTASILDLYKNTEVVYIPSKNFKSAVIRKDRNPVRATLTSAVADWLQYLGIAESVASRDRGKLGHELRVGIQNSGDMHDLTHVGVGVSQVLPILVMCLLADTDSTLVFEQPELHLHPKVQALLGDFFLSMALSNKQCIVETHSEYLVESIRFRIAAAKSEKDLIDRTKIYFVKKPSQVSLFEPVKINEYGAILDWPEGFFDQSQKQAGKIMQAASRKWKANQRKEE